MSETLGFYTLDELSALALPELAALWELVPTASAATKRSTTGR